MGVYIKGMEMPRECDLCEIWSLCWAEMPVWEDRREDCPLIEVKAPHGRLIDEDTLSRLLVGEEVKILNNPNLSTVIEAEME